MKTNLSRLSYLIVLTLAAGLSFFGGIAVVLLDSSPATVIATNAVTLGLVVLWSIALYRKLRQFLENSRNTIAPLLDQTGQQQLSVFNQMSELEQSLKQLKDRTNYMIDQMADKVLVEQEVQSAELFQSLFFPKQIFESENLVLDGRYLAANQCSGDWWQFFRSDDELLVLVGDVTGHGVAAALVTAAVQAAYSVVVSQVRKQPSFEKKIPSLNSIFSYLNEAVVAVGGTEASMTLFGSIINLKTGELTTLNASHRPAYVFRKSSGENGGGYHLHKTLQQGQTGPLGEGCDHSVQPHSFQLSPGDFIFWYTDGLFECKNAAGKMISKKDLLGAVELHMAGGEGKASQLCDTTLQEFFKLIGGRGTTREDDVIVVFGAVPATARFMESPSKKMDGALEPVLPAI